MFIHQFCIILVQFLLHRSCLFIDTFDSRVDNSELWVNRPDRSFVSLRKNRVRVVRERELDATTYIFLVSVSTIGSRLICFVQHSCQPHLDFTTFQIQTCYYISDSDLPVSESPVTADVNNETVSSDEDIVESVKQHIEGFTVTLTELRTIFSAHLLQCVSSYFLWFVLYAWTVTSYFGMFYHTYLLRS